ncbi:MAG: hypothetical protein ABEH35_06370 [Haloarculaceae archaeon]
MPHGDTGETLSTHGVDLRTVGIALQRIGVAVVLTAIPLVVVAGLVLVARAPTTAAGLGAVVDAAGGPLGAGGPDWVVHVGVLGLLSGCWLAGLGLVFDGIFG